MSRCVSCGSDHGHMFRVETHDGVVLTFDSVECALPFIAPTCSECFCQILGHAILLDQETFCCGECERRFVREQARTRARRH